MHFKEKFTNCVHKQINKQDRPRTMIQLFKRKMLVILRQEMNRIKKQNQMQFEKKLNEFINKQIHYEYKPNAGPLIMTLL